MSLIDRDFFGLKVLGLLLCAALLAQWCSPEPSAPPARQPARSQSEARARHNGGDEPPDPPPQTQERR
jgi:hypothetical protein